MRKSKFPIPVTRTVRLLGHNVRAARLRRRLRTAVVAERANITTPTLLRVERGDPTVSIGIYTTVLWVLGLSERVAELGSPATDSVGIDLEIEQLPKRIRSRRMLGLES